jgi:hypothetical protein
MAWHWRAAESRLGALRYSQVRQLPCVYGCATSQLAGGGICRNVFGVDLDSSNQVSWYTGHANSDLKPTRDDSSQRIACIVFNIVLYAYSCTTCDRARTYSDRIVCSN